MSPKAQTKGFEKQYQEEADARTLAEAEAIRSNPGRLKGAAAGAKRAAAEEEKRATESAARASGLKKLASPAKPKAPPKKGGKR